MRSAILLVLGLLGVSCGHRTNDGPTRQLSGLSPARRDALAMLRAVQSTDDARFALTRDASTFGGADASQATLRFDVSGAHLASGQSSLDLRLARMGRGTSLAPVDAVAPVADGANRVSFRRASVTEWYQNGPAGLEQGFELPAPPTGSGSLVLELAVAGLRPEVRGANVALSGDAGAAGEIRDLVVTDSDGHEVPARFAVIDGALRLEVDDLGAHYPLSIDPIIGIGNVLRPSDGGVAGAGFGWTVRARGDRVIVGSFRTNAGTTVQAGAAYVYARSGTGWVSEGKLTAPSPVAYDEFGHGVDIDNDTAIASSWKNNAQRGAIYVFKRTGSTWAYSATLTIAGAAGGIGLGNAIALDAGSVVATSQGFKRTFWVWNSLVTGASPIATVTSADTTLANWGISVGFQGGSIAIGCPDFSTTASAVVVYGGSGASWSLQSKLTNPGINFGYRVDVDGTAMIAYGNNDANTAGGAFVYRRSGTTWGLETTLFPAGMTGKYQTGGVAVSGEVALVSGAEGTLGTATVYRHGSGSTWTEQGKLGAVGGVTATNISSVGLDGDTAIIGAYGANMDAISGSGAAFAFHPVLAWPNGHACVDANQCSTGLCVDGVCCNTACTESCKACNLTATLGTCSAVPAGAPVGGRTCSPSKNCAAGGVCSSACTTIADCATGFYCGAGTCTAKKDPGAGCGAAAECKSGFCADGVCCNVACGGQCEACDVAGKNGTCTPVLGAPRPSKTKCAGATTGVDADCASSCNGVDAAACHYPSATAACGKDGCTAGIETKVGKCDGAGKCGATSRSCTPFACGASACLVGCTTKTDCAAGYSCKSSVCVASDSLGAACASSGDCLDGLFCTDGVCCGVADCGADKSCSAKPTAKGTCFAKKGAACTADAECATGFCTDGVCCDSRCDGQCEACDASGDGTCGPVNGAPHGSRAVCAAGTDVCSAQACDGAVRTSCAGFKAGPSVVCKPAECDGDSLRPESTCDGKGSCASPMTSSCGKYSCDGAASACRTTCSTASDCAKGFSCNGGVCSTGATCSTDGLSSIGSAGEKPCAPYVCGGDGDCLTSCVSSADCAPGATCDPAQKKCVPQASPGETDDSGGCAMPRDGRAGGAAALLLSMLVGLGLLSRRTGRTGR